jgi:hypothetical protein
MRLLSQVVPLAFAALVLSGCYLDHGFEPRDAAVRVDGGPILRDAGAPRDGAIGIDARSAPDAGLRCPLARAEWACFESFLIPPDRPFELPLSIDACDCCPMSECAVTVDAASRMLRATTTLCPGLCDCVACNPAVARCQVPGLSQGVWTVEVNGTIAMRLPVADDPGLVPSPPACVDFAEADACTGEGVLEGSRQRASRVCVTSGFDDRLVLRIDDDCGTCDREGPCTVTAEPRLTDDLPPGTDLRVVASRFFGACDGACPPACFETSRTCVIPPLPPGEVHRVFVEGVAPFTFVSGSGVDVCSGG